jgi:D-alanyl-lipoteichoic acid acyltransferase DltB (MBOAT superfamily)
MLFNSFEFVVFFLVTTPLYFVLPFRFRWALLLAASCVFYMAFVPVYILILLFTIVVDYAAGIWIAEAGGPRRRAYLLMSLAANIGVLGVFKYFNFFVENANAVASWLGLRAPFAPLALLLPIGLSFHTFQAMSYTIEVYRGRAPPERHFGIYSLYVMFYPQLVAGPIERPQNLLPQFRVEHDFEYSRVVSGLRLMLWGAFKKIVVADRLAGIVDAVYDHPHDAHGLGFAIASVFFAFQIYYDFSAYSDIARGCARVLGFELMLNFDRPYVARSVGEFWRRWHISLSTWFKDYVYVSLGGNRVSISRTYLNLMIVFVLSGLWHGARWNFVIWGALNGAYLVLSYVLAKPRRWLGTAMRLPENPVVWRSLDVVTTFSLVTFAWVFFRATTPSSAWFIVSHGLSEAARVVFGALHGRAVDLGLPGTPLQVVLSLLLIGLAELGSALSARSDAGERFAGWPSWGRWLTYEVAIFAILLLGEFDHRQFIYFQF